MEISAEKTKLITNSPNGIQREINVKGQKLGTVTNPFRVVLGCAYRGLTGGFLLLQKFSIAISVSPRVCFILVLILISMFLRYCIYELGIFHANQTTKCLRNQGRTKGEGWSTAN